MIRSQIYFSFVANDPECIKNLPISNENERKTNKNIQIDKGSRNEYQNMVYFDWFDCLVFGCQTKTSHSYGFDRFTK